MMSSSTREAPRQDLGAILSSQFVIPDSQESAQDSSQFSDNPSGKWDRPQKAQKLSEGKLKSLQYPFICSLSEPPVSPIHLPALKPAVCPLCKKEVDRDLLTEHQEANPRQTVPFMQRFCIRHRKHSAQDIWGSKCYPDIKWRELDQRIS